MLAVVGVDVGDAHLLHAGAFFDAAFDLIDQLLARDPPDDFAFGGDFGEEIVAFVSGFEVEVTAGDEDVAFEGEKFLIGHEGIIDEKKIRSNNDVKDLPEK